ncbi:MAG: thiamine diphosphokinase [Neomegalonema sp.]
MRDEFDPQPLRFTEPVCLVGGAVIDGAALELALGFAEKMVAADGGANEFLPGEAYASEAQRLAAVIGDMDSAKNLDHWRADDLVEVVHLPEQDSTDLEKVLRSVEAPLLLGLGFLGARFDHTLAATHALLRHPGSPVILIGEVDLIFLAPKVWRARMKAGDRISIYPLRPGRALVSQGLRWPLQGLDLAAGSQIGTSNEAIADEVSIEFAGRDAAIILTRTRLKAAIDSLAEVER